jgi:hypothetical protein
MSRIILYGIWDFHEELCLGSEAVLTWSFLNRTKSKTNEKAVFRIRIRDPVPFDKYPGTGMEKNLDPG